MSDHVIAPQVTRRLEGDQGANLVEYAMLVALIFLVALASVRFFAGNASSKMSCAASSINTAQGTAC